jgi:hypothetical protein
MKAEKLVKFNNYIIIIPFFLIFIFGIISVKEFGSSSDESGQRHSGFILLNHIGEKYAPDLTNKFKGDRKYTDLFDPNYTEKYVGHFINAFSALVEVVFNIQDRRDAFLFKHYLYFILFYLALICFYKICQIRFNNRFISMIGVLFIFLNPRIFANSFYDPKDIPFLCGLIFSFYFGLIFFKKPNLKNLIFFSIVSSLITAGIYVFSIIVPILILCSMFIYSISNEQHILKKRIFTIFLTFILIFLITILLNPYFLNYPKNLFDLFIYLDFFGENKNTFSQKWQIPNLFFGKIVLAKDVPFYYNIFWILISTPIFYILLSLLGIFFYIISLIRNLKNNFYELKFYYDSIFLFMIIIPLFLSVLKKDTSYNSWRHLYFIYPYIVIFSLSGIVFIINYLKKYLLSSYFYSLVFLILIYNFYWIVKNHPFQYAYFNFLAGKNLNQKFDIDYHGLSYKQNLEYILLKDKREKISIVNNSINKPILFQYSLKKNDRERFIFDQNNKNPDYIITNYYLEKIPKNKKINDEIIASKYYIYKQIIVDDVIVNTVYKKKN